MFKVTQLGVLEPGWLEPLLPRCAACFPPDLTTHQHLGTQHTLDSTGEQTPRSALLTPLSLSRSRRDSSPAQAPAAGTLTSWEKA